MERRPEDEGVTVHNMVPETATSTHYFFCSTRQFLVDDVQFSHYLRGALRTAFEGEDKPMLERQQQRIGEADLWSLNPLLLPIDAAAKAAIFERNARRVFPRLDALLRSQGR